MPQRWAAATPAGRTAPLAGYERWGFDIAHLGVLARRELRGQGYAREAAARPVSEAVHARLLAQWRSRVGNSPSAGLARHLGFTWMGRQSAVALEA
jgi:RimJ/RimL family protein N-acetyltransferase